jgi:hypothetical protein
MNAQPDTEDPKKPDDRSQSPHAHSMEGRRGRWQRLEEPLADILREMRENAIIG